MIRNLIAGAALAAAVTASLPANASIILLNDVQLSGQGIGSQTTALTLQSMGNATIESGGVNLSGPFGDAQTGASQSQLFSLSTLGLTNANRLGFVVNLSEPGSESPPAVTLTALSLTAFSGGTETIFSLAPEFVGITLEQVGGGLGGSGIVFALDADQAAQLTALGVNTLLGVSATFNGAAGGQDAIQVVNLNAIPPDAEAAVPEATTWAMMMLGFAGIGLTAYGRSTRKNRRKFRVA